MLVVWTQCVSLYAAPPSLIPLPFTSNGRRTHNFVPTTATSYKTTWYRNPKDHDPHFYRRNNPERLYCLFLAYTRVSCHSKASNLQPGSILACTYKSSSWIPTVVSYFKIIQKSVSTSPMATIHLKTEQNQLPKHPVFQIHLMLRYCPATGIKLGLLYMWQAISSKNCL